MDLHFDRMSRQYGVAYNREIFFVSCRKMEVATLLSEDPRYTFTDTLRCSSNENASSTQSKVHLSPLCSDVHIVYTP